PSHIPTLSLHDALPIWSDEPLVSERHFRCVHHTYSTKGIAEEKRQGVDEASVVLGFPVTADGVASAEATCNLFAFLPVRDYGFQDRKSTRLNSSHVSIS